MTSTKLAAGAIFPAIDLPLLGGGRRSLSEPRTGADWVLDSVPALLGAEDDWSAFEPRHPVLAEARRRHPHAHPLPPTECRQRQIAANAS